MEESDLLVDFPCRGEESVKTSSSSEQDRAAGMDMSDHPIAVGHAKLEDLIPEEYLYDPYNAEPTLENLREAAHQLESSDPDPDDDDDMADSHADLDEADSSIADSLGASLAGRKKKTALGILLEAANADVTLHTARIMAVLAKDVSLLRSYLPAKDPELLERSRRLKILDEHRRKLQAKEGRIISALNLDLDLAGGGVASGAAGAGASVQKDNVTRANVLQARLKAWEEALQLYIFCPPSAVDSASASNSSNAATSSSSKHKPPAAASPTSSKPSLSLLQLLHHLTLIAKQDEPLATTAATDETSLTQTLSHAMALCTSHLDTVSEFLTDANEQANDRYQSYQIHLIAHSIAANRTLERTEEIHDSFLLHGREALKVGHALEMAEAKRRQSERASVLIRRWWMMENLAETEEFSGEEIKVMEEVRGVIPSSSCRMDPLFTNPDHSLEASRVLKSLRMVVKCQSNTGSGATTKEAKSPDAAAAANANNPADSPDAKDNNNNSNNDNSNDDTNNTTTPNNEEKENTTTTTPNPNNFMSDPLALKRFERTSNLLQRTSTALEKRLLNTFSQIYTNAGTYDFSSVSVAKRNGKLNWVTLRECAEALMNFDSGRSLHQRFVDLVVTTKFPELFLEGDAAAEASITKIDEEAERFVYDSDVDDSGSSNNPKTMRRMNTEEQEMFDMDATRTKLSKLFHRVGEVCTDEFQLIAHIFSPTLPPHLHKELGMAGGPAPPGAASASSSSSFSDTYPLHVARALLQRIISDPYKGMQAQINDLLDGIDRRGDSDTGSQKLDTFVVIHEKAAGLFSLLKEAAQKMWDGTAVNDRRHRRKGLSTADPPPPPPPSESLTASNNNAQSITSLIQFLTAQEMALSSGQRRGYVNLELRLLHHECCANLDKVRVKFLKPIQTYSAKEQSIRGARALGHPPKGTAAGANKTPTLVEFRAPIMPIDKDYILKGGFTLLLNGPLKSTVMRQPLIHATDSLARARLMFGSGQHIDHDDIAADNLGTARVVVNIFMQMCNFYGNSYLFPIVESLGKMVVKKEPTTPPVLPFDKNAKPHDLGVDGNFWICIERIHSAAKQFDRELWAENRTGSVRVWEILTHTRSMTSLTIAKDRRIKFFHDLEERGEAVILHALNTLSTHIMWILVTGGENVAGSGGTTNRLMKNFTGGGGGPYAVHTGAHNDNTNSPAVEALTLCLREQFLHIQAALTPQSLSAFWTALSMRLYDILVKRLLLNYYVSIDGAILLSHDVEALRTVAMLAGTKHSHWTNLRELLTLFMTPPDALRTMLVGKDGDVNSGKGMFAQVGKDQSLVFMSRRIDYRYKSGQTMKKSDWVIKLLEDLGVNDPTDGRASINIAPYSAENMMENN